MFTLITTRSNTHVNYVGYTKNKTCDPVQPLAYNFCPVQNALRTYFFPLLLANISFNAGAATNTARCCRWRCQVWRFARRSIHSFARGAIADPSISTD